MSESREPIYPASFDTMIDELVAAGAEIGDKKATREEVARYATDYTGEFLLLYGQLKAKSPERDWSTYEGDDDQPYNSDEYAG